MEKIGTWWVPCINEQVRRNLNTAENYRHVKPFVKSWSLALDCGAFVGGWTRELQEDFERVVAVEMDPINASCVKANTDAEVVVGCLAATPEKTVKYAPDRHKDSRIYCVDNEGSSEALTITIDQLDLSPDFIKLDLQGYETIALWGAEETLKRSKPLLFFEHEKKCWIRYGLDGSELPEFLTKLGAKEIKSFGHDTLWGWTS